MQGGGIEQCRPQTCVTVEEDKCDEKVGLADKGVQPDKFRAVSKCAYIVTDFHEGHGTAMKGERVSGVNFERGTKVVQCQMYLTEFLVGIADDEMGIGGGLDAE